MEAELETGKSSLPKESCDLSAKVPLDIPLPLECPTTQDTSLLTTSLTKTSVLGIQNAKKRLKGFFIAKRALEAKSVDTELGILKNNAFLSNKKSSESIAEKKKSKKGLTPSEKAKATITEIEEIKRKEALHHVLYSKKPYLREYGYRNPSRDRRASNRSRSNSWRYKSSRRSSPDKSSKRYGNNRTDYRSHSSSRHEPRNLDKRHEIEKSRHVKNEKSNSKEKNDEKNNKKAEKKDSKDEICKQVSSENKKKIDDKKKSPGKILSPGKFVTDTINIPENGLNNSDQSKRLSFSSCQEKEEFHNIQIMSTNDTVNNEVCEKPDNEINEILYPHSLTKEDAMSTEACIKPKEVLSVICAYNSDSHSGTIQQEIKNLKIDYNPEKNSDNFLGRNSPQLLLSCDSMFSMKPSQSSTTSKRDCQSDLLDMSNISYKIAKKNPYAKFVRHPHIFERYTVTIPVLSFSENPAYRNMSRNWYPHHKDSLRLTTSSLNTKECSNISMDENLASESNTIDMGDYDTTKNDISNRELAMNSEPPPAVQANDLNTEYEEFLRAVTVESSGQDGILSKKDQTDNVGCLDMDIDLLQFIKDKSIEKISNNDHNITNEMFSNLSKMYQSSTSNEYSSSSESSSSTNSLSSSDSDDSDSSSDSSSDDDSDSSSSTSSSNFNGTPPKKQKLHIDKKKMAKPIIDIDIIPIPLIIKQEKELELKVQQYEFNPNIRIKQEPLDVSFTEKTSTDNDERTDKKLNHCKKNIMNDKIRNYNGKSFKLLDWEESSQSYDDPETTENIFTRKVNDICDIPLPQIATHSLLSKNNVHLPLMKTFENNNDSEINDKRNHFISFKLPSNYKRNLNPGLAEQIEDEAHTPEKEIPENVHHVLNKECISNKKCIIEISTQIDKLVNDDDNMQNNDRKSRSSSKSLDLNNSFSSTRSSSKSSERSSRRSWSPRNHKYSSDKFYYERNNSDRQNYKNHQSRHRSSRDNKYDDNFYENRSHILAYHSDRNTHINDDCEVSPRNESFDKQSISTGHGFSSDSTNIKTNHDRTNNDKRSTQNYRNTDCNTDIYSTATEEVIDDRCHTINDDYLIKPKEIYTENVNASNIKSTFSSKVDKIDLDNIPLPSQNLNLSQRSEITEPSVIPTLMNTKENFITQNINPIHPSTTKDTYECDYYNDHYSERRQFVSSPKRISLDARINMVLGLTELNANDHNNSQPSIDYNSSNYPQSYSEVNQYNRPISSNVDSFPQNPSADYIQTIHTYTQTANQVPKRRAQTANLVSVVLTDDSFENIKPLEKAKSPVKVTPLSKVKSPIKIKSVAKAKSPINLLSIKPVATFTSGIFDCITKIVKLGGPLLILPPDVAKIESREIFEQIENFILDENNQKRFKTPLPKPEMNHFENKWYQQDIYLNNTETNVVGSSDMGCSMKGILINSYFSKHYNNHNKQCKLRKVKFADGILPGEGTSTSGGEEMMSPPPPGVDSKAKRKRKKTKKNRKNDFLDGYWNLPPPPPPEDDPPSFLLQPCDIAENAALGFTDIPKALERFSIFFNSALSRKSESFSGDVIGS